MGKETSRSRRLRIITRCQSNFPFKSRFLQVKIRDVPIWISGRRIFRMFTFLNTIEVLPTASVDVIHQFLSGSDLNVPVLLKAKSGMPGCVAIHAWIPLAEPICRTLSTEWIVCPDHASELRTFLDGFVAEVHGALEVARREMVVAAGGTEAPIGGQ
jgi:hypothetical protein